MSPELARLRKSKLECLSELDTSTTCCLSVQSLEIRGKKDKTVSKRAFDTFRHFIVVLVTPTRMSRG